MNNPAKGPGLAAMLGRNAAFGVVARVVQVGTRLATVPMVISHLGLGAYGIWSIIMMTAAYMRFGSIGVKCGFQKYVAEASGNGKYLVASRLLSTGSALMATLSLAVLIPVTVCSGTLVRYLGVPDDYRASAASATSVLALIFMLSNGGAVYEAILNGAQRLDLTRNLATAFTLAEAVAIVIALRFGCGLVAMACVMAASELGFVICCRILSRRLVPEIRLSLKLVGADVVPELIRYIGSYQVVALLELLYLAILPVTILRRFGPDLAGVYALAIRITSSALMLPDALLLPLLSGGAMVYASQDSGRMGQLVAKALKVTLLLGLVPLTFVSIFGPSVVFAWTGESLSGMRAVLVGVCVAGMFETLARLGSVLYRASGKAGVDSVRQVIRIGIVALAVIVAQRSGFYGLLVGLAITEMIGMLFMLDAVRRTYLCVPVNRLLGDAGRAILASVSILAVGYMFSLVPWPPADGSRITALAELLKAGVGSLLFSVPALVWLKVMDEDETRVLRGIAVPPAFKRRSIVQRRGT